MIGSNDAIQLIGKVEHSKLQYRYSSADFIIAGSHHEGSGVAVIEALSCGCIPILTAIPSFNKMTGPGKCGLTYKVGSETELLNVLMKTIQMDIEKERDRTLKQFNKELSFEAIAGKIEDLITALKERNGD